MRPLLTLLPVALMAAAVSLPAYADNTAKPSTISIEGRGEAVTAPDTAFVNAGVTTTAKTARDALTDNTKAMADLVAALKTAGVGAADIQTSGFSVNPQYFYPEKPADGAPQAPTISGYQVQNGVNVRVRKITDLGGILDQIVTVGANTINGVSFSVDDPKKLLDEARKAAFADAESRAKIYADAAGVDLGDILTITEQPQGGGGMPRPYAMKAMAADAAVPVEAGQLTYDVSVAVQWTIKAQAK